MTKAGLRKVVKTVRSKNGTARRSYWVKGAEKAKRVAKFIGKHSGKIATGVAVAGVAYGLYKAHKFNGDKGAAFHGFKNWVNQGAQRQAYRSAAGRKDHTGSVANDVAEAQRRQQAGSDWRNHVADTARAKAGSANLRLPSRTYRKRKS